LTPCCDFSSRHSGYRNSFLKKGTINHGISFNCRIVRDRDIPYDDSSWADENVISDPRGLVWVSYSLPDGNAVAYRAVFSNSSKPMDNNWASMDQAQARTEDTRRDAETHPRGQTIESIPKQSTSEISKP